MLAIWLAHRTHKARSDTLEAVAMDSMTLLLFVVPLLLGMATGAVKFMRFVGFVAGGRKRTPTSRGRNYGDQLSFDERVAERLRELDRDRS